MDVVTILLSAFVVSIVALGLFIWSMRHGVLDDAATGADVIFAPHEKGHIKDPSAAPGARGALGWRGGLAL